MPTTWINYKDLRSRLNFEQVLQHYRVEIRRKGSQHHGFCPLPKHEGKKNSMSFSANLERGIFKCFGCGAKGNLLDFAGLMENIDLTNTKAFRDVALRLQERFCPGQENAPARATAAEATSPQEQDKPNSEEKDVIVNPPLDFELKGLVRDHSYLLNRGFTQETIDYFGLGFCSRGYFKDRVVIPLYDQEGKLIGYAGRVVDDSLISGNNPRYLFPGKREREGKSLEFRKSEFVYNGNRIQGTVDDLIIVEGFASVWWLHQNGFPNVVATMGAGYSDKQVELIISVVAPTGRVWLMPDGDRAGEGLAKSLSLPLFEERFVRWIRLREHSQPTDLTVGQLKNYFLQ
jgi:DNA primase